MSAQEASRRIPKNLDDNDTLWGYNTSDLITAGVPVGTSIFLLQAIPEPYSGQLALPLMGLGILIGVIMLFLTPSHLGTKEWVSGIGHHIRRPQVVEHVALSDGMSREQKDYVTESKIYEVNERTQDLTRVKQIHRNGHAVERTDGGVVGAIKVEPANMALASEQSWQQMVNEWEGYLNNSVEYPLQIFSTTQKFPVEEYMEHYEMRINDSDIEDRPILQELLRDFLDWYPEYLSWQGTNQREYYILVSVDQEELVNAGSDEEGVMEQLATLPVVGGFFQRFAEDRNTKSDAELEAELLKTLSSRCEAVKRQGVQSLSGCSAYRLSALELSILLKEYWEGREYELEENAVRTQPAVQRGEGAVTPSEVANDRGHGGRSSNVEGI